MKFVLVNRGPCSWPPGWCHGQGPGAKGLHAEPAGRPRPSPLLQPLPPRVPWHHLPPQKALALLEKALAVLFNPANDPLSCRMQALHFPVTANVSALPPPTSHHWLCFF